ncbi:MAG TPA: lipopolysaccharide core heptose(I) kinase RfaP [Cellvibrio sp.]|nr:lipopolysaccharide core heptose(I) kinase RfaP [Cellvibrio sp.]
MRLAFVIFRYFPYGGLQRDMLAMAREAQARGHDVSIFCGEWSGEKPKKIKVQLISSSDLFTRRSAKHFAENFSQQFARNNFDMVIGFNKMPGLDVYFSGDSCFAQKAYAERSIFYRLTARARLYLNYENAVFSPSAKTHILSLTAAEQKSFARCYGTPPERFHPLPPGILPAQFQCRDALAARSKIRRELGVDPQAKIVLCLGSGFRTKGLDRSIAAFAEVRAQFQQPMLLLVVGADKAKPYIAQAQRLGISEQVVFLGGRTDIADILQAADVLLHPAYRELAGNVILEAMLAGKPVVASDVCGFAPYVREWQMGAVVTTPHSLQQFVSALAQVLAGDPLRWQAPAQQFALNADVFSRQASALDVIESLSHKTQVPASEWIDETASHKIILRDEMIANWQGRDIFARVQTLSGPVARELPDRQTMRFELEGKGYYRKLHRGVGWQEIFKNLLQLRLPVLGAKNEWLALNRLRALTIPSLEPVAYGEQKTSPALKKSFIVTRELSGVVQLDHYFQQPVALAEKSMLVRKLADIARELHLGGINHRDFYLCHFMLDLESMKRWRSQGVEPNLYLVDLHRAQIRRQVPRRWLVKDLSGLYFSSLGLGFSDRDYYRFMRSYWQLPLREIFQQNRSLLPAIAARAAKTYKRDFGIEPVMPLAELYVKDK